MFDLCQFGFFSFFSKKSFNTLQPKLEKRIFLLLQRVFFACFIRVYQFSLVRQFDSGGILFYIFSFFLNHSVLVLCLLNPKMVVRTGGNNQFGYDYSGLFSNSGLTHLRESLPILSSDFFFGGRKGPTFWFVCCCRLNINKSLVGLSRWKKRKWENHAVEKKSSRTRI